MRYLRDRNFRVSGLRTWSKTAPSEETGGARGGRTHDLFRAREALSQLSYSPISHIYN